MIFRKTFATTAIALTVLAAGSASALADGYDGGNNGGGYQTEDNSREEEARGARQGDNYGRQQRRQHGGGYQGHGERDYAEGSRQRSYSYQSTYQESYRETYERSYHQSYGSSYHDTYEGGYHTGHHGSYHQPKVRIVCYLERSYHHVEKVCFYI